MRALAATGLLLGCSMAWATDNAVPAERATAPDSGMLEGTRAGVRSAAEWLARSVDGWFGDHPFDDGGKVTDGRLRLSLLKRQDQSADIDLRFNARFQLPNARRSTYLFIGRDDPREVAQDRPEQISGQQDVLRENAAERSFQAGLGVALRENIDFRVGVRGRLKAYVQARYDQPWELKPHHVVRLRQTVFWTYDDRLGSTTALTYDWSIAPELVLRWLNAATITQESRQFQWSSTVGLYRLMGPQRLLSLELVVNGTGSGTDTSTGTGSTNRGLQDYGALVKWEQPVHKDWLLAEFVAGHFWPRNQATSARGTAWALGAGLKMRF